MPEVHEKLEDVTLAALDQWRRKNLNHETGPSFTEANVPDLPADA